MGGYRFNAAARFKIRKNSILYFYVLFRLSGPCTAFLFLLQIDTGWFNEKTKEGSAVRNRVMRMPYYGIPKRIAAYLGLL